MKPLMHANEREFEEENIGVDSRSFAVDI